MKRNSGERKPELIGTAMGTKTQAYSTDQQKIRQATRSMSMLRNETVILQEQEDIQHVLSYFSSLYATDNECVDNDLIAKVVPQSVSQLDNDFLTKIPFDMEIREVVFAMNGEGAPGPNGFDGCFYHSFWDIIGHDVCKAVNQFFIQGWMLPNLNSNSVVLIRKSKGADRIEDFRPIALANFQFKIITKTLADRVSYSCP